MRHLRIPLRIVFYREEGKWFAHCLEFDLAAHGDTKPQAIRQLADAIATQLQATVKHNNPENLFTPAEGRYFEMFAAGDDIANAELQVVREIRVDSVEIAEAQGREYTGAELTFA